MDDGRGRSDQARLRGYAHPAPARSLRAGGCFITVRASGIRARACRAGPSRSIGAAMGCRYGAIAWGRDYGDVAPINGIVTGGGDHLIEVGVDVAPANLDD